MAPPPVSSLAALELPILLKERIVQVRKGNLSNPELTGSFVLYLPTVVLRKKHNPALALACRLANHHNVPLIILAVVLDDAHLPSSSLSSEHSSKVAMTARRLAFHLEALQYVSNEWEQHGAGVAIRVHGPGSRTPHHLTLAQRALAVVTDEPFVHPYLSFVQSVERVSAGMTFRVDGSCTVPPNGRLERTFNEKGNICSCKGLPAKAWRWEKMTKDQRRAHVHGAVLEGHLDAPELKVRLDPIFFLNRQQQFKLDLPADWQNQDAACPSRRPWTTQELSSIGDLKLWASQWAGADASVPPSKQTHGSLPAAQKRWSVFLNEHLLNYAKLRNQIQKPHAVSRISCYLNCGVLSIFQVIYDLERHRASNNSRSAVGVAKFEDEIIKWREISYAHAFSTENYNKASSVPAWALRYLEQCRINNRTIPTNVGRARGIDLSLSLDQLATGRTHDATWNAMQQYLASTGELHNNARMTWGKTLVHWLSNSHNNATADEILEQICYLNDRYALDGLAPPSYAGLLWCLGWGDKPSNTKSGGISKKCTSRYRVGPEGFRLAEQLLLVETTRNQPLSIVNMIAGPTPKRQKTNQDSNDKTAVVGSKRKTVTPKKDTKKTLLSYFGATANKEKHAPTIG